MYQEHDYDAWSRNGIPDDPRDDALSVQYDGNNDRKLASTGATVSGHSKQGSNNCINHCGHRDILVYVTLDNHVISFLSLN